MQRGFPLAGLLRVRRLQEEQAAAELAHARSRADREREREQRMRAALGGADDEVTSVEALAALAASRAASRSLLSDLGLLVREREAQAEKARQEHAVTRVKAAGLERLEERHGAAVAAEDLRVEQHALDEIAGAKSARTGGRAGGAAG